MVDPQWMAKNEWVHATQDQPARNILSSARGHLDLYSWGKNPSPDPQPSEWEIREVSCPLRLRGPLGGWMWPLSRASMLDPRGPVLGTVLPWSLAASTKWMVSGSASPLLLENENSFPFCPEVTSTQEKGDCPPFLLWKENYERKIMKGNLFLREINHPAF